MSTVNSKMTALADEVRALSGTTTSKSIDAMTTDVNAANTEIIEQTDLIAQIAIALEGKVGGGVELPSLSNPAGAADILNGKEAIDGDGNKITGNILSQAAKTVTPTTSDQTAVSSGRYTTGAVTVKGDSNLKAENIKSGVSIFGVTGSYEGSGGSVETADVTLINTNSDWDYDIFGVWVENNYISSYATTVWCDDSKVKTALKNSYITIDSSIFGSASGNYTNLGTIVGTAEAICINGDCTITLK